jgi:hypothetical protein
VHLPLALVSALGGVVATAVFVLMLTAACLSSARAGTERA